MPLLHVQASCEKAHAACTFYCLLLPFVAATMVTRFPSAPALACVRAIGMRCVSTGRARVMLLGACRGQAFLAAYFFAASVAAGSVVARLAALLLEREEAAVEAAIIDSTTWLHKADLFDTGGVTEADYGERAVEPTTVRRNSPLTHRFARKLVFSRSLEHHSVFPLSRAPRVPVIAMRPGTRHVVPRRRCASSIRWCPCTLALMRDRKSVV